MAKLNTMSVVITVSELIRDNEELHELIDDATIAQIEEVIKELAQENATGPLVVEVIKATE